MSTGSTPLSAAAVPHVAGEGTCRAPFAAMRLHPDGQVLTCCVNDEVPLGSITRSTLREIWDGATTASLRRAMEVGDFSLGCQPCGDLRDLGLRSVSLAQDYDWLDPVPDLRWPRHIEFALSNTCNLQCVQCSGELSSAIRAQREHRPPLPASYTDAFFEELRDFVPHLRSSSFIGGEPFLAREARRVWDLMIELDARPMVWVTTNGTVWNDRVERYLRELRMGVSLSIDGVEPATIASIRVGADPDELLANRDRFLATTRSYGGSVKLNYCVMSQNWREFLPFLQEADRLDVDVYAARVHEPAEFSLFRLPTPELRDVLDELRAQDGAATLGRNRHVWDDMLQQLTARLAEAEQALSAVRVALPSRRSVPDDAALRPAVDELRRWAGRDPVVVSSSGGTVRAVEVPDWAGWLRPEGWVGSELAVIGDLVAAGLGSGELAVEGVEQVAPGVNVARSTVTWADGRIEARALFVEGDGLLLLFVRESTA